MTQIHHKHQTSDTVSKPIPLPPGKVMELSDDDVKINFRKPLGEGGFCMVYPVQVKGIKEQLALKRLRLGIRGNAVVVKEALQDLNHELTILSALSSHENVIQLHGYRKCGNGGEDGPDKDFFIVMDMLKDTLDDRFDEWEENRSFFQHSLSEETVITRLREVVMGIANGMEYIHSKQIIHRDLKPSNIGFDYQNRVKILDFGFATPCQPHMGSSPFRGEAGTPRYMAPEVANNEFYGLPADVYSFTIMLWQVCTSRLPFEEEVGMCCNIIPPEDTHPPLKYVESKALQRLMRAGWNADPNERPTFGNICIDLEKIISSPSTTSTPPSMGKTVWRTGFIYHLQEPQPPPQFHIRDLASAQALGVL